MRPQRKWLATAGVMSLLFVASSSPAATQQAKLSAFDEAAGDQLGSSVAVQGSTAIVGAPLDDHAGKTDAGSAYVFVRSGTTWVHQAKLTAGDAASGDSFGVSVAVSGNTAVVGARNDDHSGKLDAGSAYVFVRSGTTWTQQEKLTAADSADLDSFGDSVAIDSDTVVVGARRDDHTAASSAGSAYVFVRSGTNWTQQAKLVAVDPGSGDFFGDSVAISSSTAVVGAPFDDHTGGPNAGSAYVFVRSGSSWTQQKKLIAPDTDADDSFGLSVAISLSTVAVGAPGDDHYTGSDQGSAYVFVRSGATWDQGSRLEAGDAGSLDLFGSSVAIWRDTLLVGAPRDDHSGAFQAGSAYVFVRSLEICALCIEPETIWTQQEKLVTSNPAPDDWFGHQVALSADTAVVGAPLENHLGVFDVGSAYALAYVGCSEIEEDLLRILDGVSASAAREAAEDICTRHDPH